MVDVSRTSTIYSTASRKISPEFDREASDEIENDWRITVVVPKPLRLDGQNGQKNWKVVASGLHWILAETYSVKMVATID